MHSNFALRAALAASLIVAVAACGDRNAAPADTAAALPTPTSSSAPMRVTDIQLGKGVGADKRIVTPATTFGSRDTIYVSVTTEGTGNDARLTATWMYNGSQAVSEEDQMVSSAGGVNVTEFHVSKATPWPAGAYHVEVKLNGESAGRREFQIQ